MSISNKVAAALILGCLVVGLLAGALGAGIALRFAGGLDTAGREALVRDALMSNPEIVRDAFIALQEREEAAQAERQRQALAEAADEVFRSPADFVAGNPEGDVTLVEFFDYRCPYCKRVMATLEELRKRDRKLRMVYKEFPILGPDSIVAARAAIASRAQGKYLEFHDALMASRGELGEKAVVQIAAEVGLDVERLFNDMRDPKIDQIIRRNYALAQALGVSGTPTFVVGDEIVRGAVTIDKLEASIEQARSGCLTC